MPYFAHEEQSGDTSNSIIAEQWHDGTVVMTSQKRYSHITRHMIPVERLKDFFQFMIEAVSYAAEREKNIEENAKASTSASLRHGERVTPLSGSPATDGIAAVNNVNDKAPDEITDRVLSFRVAGDGIVTVSIPKDAKRVALQSVGNVWSLGFDMIDEPAPTAEAI